MQGRLVLGQEPQTIEMSLLRGNVDGSGTIIFSLLQGRLVLGQEPQTFLIIFGPFNLYIWCIILNIFNTKTEAYFLKVINLNLYIKKNIKNSF